MQVGDEDLHHPEGVVEGVIQQDVVEENPGPAKERKDSLLRSEKEGEGEKLSNEIGRGETGEEEKLANTLGNEDDSSSSSHQGSAQTGEEDKSLFEKIIKQEEVIKKTIMGGNTGLEIVEWKEKFEKYRIEVEK